MKRSQTAAITKKREALRESRLAIGALLGFYRRRTERSSQSTSSQFAVSKRAFIKKSALAMYESGRRTPSMEAIDGLAAALKMDGLQKRQLQLLAEYPTRAAVRGEEWFLPDDVLTGIPVFLRTLLKESQLQREADISEMWIVTSRPLALDGEMYTMLSDRIHDKRTRFVYFVDSGATESPFQALWRKLCSERRHKRSEITERLRCVLVPSSISLSHFAICNPGRTEGDMFGRYVFYAGGAPVGFFAMDSNQVARAYHMLDPIYRRCQMDPGRTVKTPFGEFRLVEPKIKLS